MAKLKGKATFAKRADKIVNKYSKRPFDGLDREQMNRELDKLKEEQEGVKVKFNVPQNKRSYKNGNPPGSFEEAVKFPGSTRGKPSDFDTSPNKYKVLNFPEGTVYFSQGSEGGWKWDVAPDANTNFSKRYAQAVKAGESQFEWNGRQIAVKPAQMEKAEEKVSYINAPLTPIDVQGRTELLTTPTEGLVPMPEPQPVTPDVVPEPTGAGFDPRKAMRFISPASRALGAAWLSKQKVNYKGAPPYLEEYRRTDINPLIANARASYATADRGAGTMSNQGARLLTRSAIGSQRARELGSTIGGLETEDTRRWQDVERRNVATLNDFSKFNVGIDARMQDKNLQIKQDALGLGIDAATETSNLIQADLLADAVNQQAMNMAGLAGTANYGFTNAGTAKDPRFQRQFINTYTP